MESLLNKHVLIVGATGGIGSETARLLKSSSAHVYLAARDAGKLRDLADQLGIPAERCFVVDVRFPEQVEAMAKALHAQTPQLDILINATGAGILRPIEQLTYEDFDRCIDVNLKGAFYLLKAFLPPMVAVKKGLVINMPGVLGKTPMAGSAAYSAAKYGLNGMLKSVREDIKRTNIRITNVYMGGVDTPFWDNIDLKVRKDAFILAKEAAKSVWFLCQQPSSGVVSEMVIQPFNHQAI
jgi:NADP-dependent 3-hydroxy acid dehydrogenase YdfG